MPLPIIGIDCRFAGTHSGIGRYVRELVHALAKRDDPWNYVLFLPDIPHGLEHTTSNRIRHSSFVIRHYSLHEHLEFPKILRTSNIDLLHVPHFNAPLFCPVPFIATIHDLILHHYPNEVSLPKRLAYRLLMGNAVRKSAHIIAVSQAMANDLTQTYGDELRRKISVISEGIQPAFKPVTEEQKNGIRKKYNLPDRFILYVGAAKEHKNVQTLIDACPSNIPLILVTGGKEISKLRLRSNVRILSNIADADLPALYGTASCFVTASLAEGFGLPILEAMACGCPVVASNRGSIPEIAEGHAILVEPTVEGISEGIKKALTEPLDPKAAMTHARTFSWERAAEETVKIYDLCLRKASRAD